MLGALSQREQPGSKPTRPRGFRNAVAVTASVVWGIEGLDSGDDQPGFGRTQGRPSVVGQLVAAPGRCRVDLGILIGQAAWWSGEASSDKKRASEPWAGSSLPKQVR